MTYSGPSAPPSDVSAGMTGHVDVLHGQLNQCVAALIESVQALPDLLWGTATLSGGQAVVTCGQIGTGSLVFASRQALAGAPGHLSVANIIPGVSFTIVSSSSTDASAIAYLIIP
jgi:hypothetical protein